MCDQLAVVCDGSTNCLTEKFLRLLGSESGTAAAILADMVLSLEDITLMMPCNCMLSWNAAASSLCWGCNGMFLKLKKDFGFTTAEASAVPYRSSFASMLLRVPFCLQEAAILYESDLAAFIAVQIAVLHPR